MQREARHRPVRPLFQELQTAEVDRVLPFITALGVPFGMEAVLDLIT